MVEIAVIGDVKPQCTAVFHALWDDGVTFSGAYSQPNMAYGQMVQEQPDLIIVAGWRHLIPPWVLAIPRLGVVGFHSAKLPEYPGRAPVPWTLLRGDDYAYNTMFYLDEGVDSGDIIDQERYWIRPGDTPDDIYRWVAESDVRLLRKHLPGLLDGTAPRAPQDPAKRGPLTTADGWKRHASLPRYTP